MNGTRQPDGTSPHLLKPGEYVAYKGEWYACAPNGLLAGLSRHSVTEDAARNITVTPSILVSDGQGNSWHGFITNGVWNEC